MMELKIASRFLTDEAGKLRRLHYFLLVDELEAGSFFCEQYGVKIAEEDGDCAQIRGITTSAVRIDELNDHTGGAAGSALRCWRMWCRTGCDRDTGQHYHRLPLRETLLFFLSPAGRCAASAPPAERWLPRTTKMPSIPCPIISKACVIFSMFECPPFYSITGWDCWQNTEAPHRRPPQRRSGRRR